MSKRTPCFLDKLLDYRGGQISKHFRKNIRAYNSIFAFTSLGASIDHSINKSKGPKVFKICGQIYHLMGSLLSEENQLPRFAQLYICDTDNEVNNRVLSVCGDEQNDKLDRDIVKNLINMLDDSNKSVRIFRNIRDRYKESSVLRIRLRLLSR